MYTRLGDLSQHLSLLKHNKSLKSQLNTLSYEVSTGYAENKLLKLNGDTDYFSSISHDIGLLKAYKQSALEVKNTLSSKQTVLSAISTHKDELSKNLLLTPNNTSPVHIRELGLEAKQSFEDMVSLLNTQVSGKTLFSGDKVDSNSLLEGKKMLELLFQEVKADVSPAVIIEKVEAWFDSENSGYQQSAYKGVSGDGATRTVGKDISIRLDVTANHSAIRNLLKATAISAISTRMSHLSHTDKATLLLDSGKKMHSLSAEYNNLQAHIGFSEERVEQSLSRNTARQKSYEIQHNELIGVDQYETASNLNTIKTQLEMHYRITANLSQLSLVNYI